MFFVSFTKTQFYTVDIGICYGYSLPEIRPAPCDKFLHTSSPMNQNGHDSANDDLRHEITNIPRYWSFAREIHRWQTNSSNKVSLMRKFASSYTNWTS